MLFSRRQQQVLGGCCLIYGLWLWLLGFSGDPESVMSYQLAHPDPPTLPFYIDPPVDINRADKQELQLLPSVGKVLARRILLYRNQYGNFSSLASLENIPGIGPKTLEKLQHYLVFPSMCGELVEP